MKILLDTHVVLWAIADPARLSPRARILLLDDEHELLFSAASIWEIQLKRRAGKLILPDDKEEVRSIEIRCDRAYQ